MGVVLRVEMMGDTGLEEGDAVRVLTEMLDGVRTLWTLLEPKEAPELYVVVSGCLVELVPYDWDRKPGDGAELPE